MITSLITGGAGFIGSHIADLLAEKGHHLIIIDNLSTGKRANIHPKAKLYEADIQDASISNIFKKEKPDFVFHLAAQIDARASVDDPILDSKVNILGAINILENSAKNNVKKVIFPSSCTVYGEANTIPTPETSPTNPLSPYGINKLAIEKYLQYYKTVKGLNYITLRLGNVYGPRQNSRGEAGVIAIFIDKLLHGERPMIFGDGKQTRDYTYVEDVAQAFIMAQEKKICGEFNISTGKETNVNEILEKITQKMKKNITPVYCPSKPGDEQQRCLDWRKAKKELGWSPKYDLDEGIKETINWFQVCKNKNSEE